jgi:periodic tryptophan protein 1
MLPLASAANAGPTKALWTLAAHDGSVSSLDISVHMRGCFVTGGVDKTVKIWNATEREQGRRDVGLVVSRDLGVGKVFSASFCPEDPTTLAVAGSRGSLQLWDSATNAGVRRAFGPRLAELGKDASHKNSDGVVRLVDDDDGEGENDDDE